MQGKIYESAAAVGRRLGVHRNAVVRYSKMPGFPKPLITPTGRMLFEIAKIEEWIQNRGLVAENLDTLTIDGQEYLGKAAVYRDLGLRSAGMRILLEIGKIKEPVVVNGADYFLKSEIEDLCRAYS